MSVHFAILIFKSEDDSQVKEIFTLHPGENTIGSDNDCDIVIQLSDNSIESLHAKVIVSDDFKDIGIEDISISNTIFREKDGQRLKLKKRREYELIPNRIFYLTQKMKFFLFEGKLDTIENYLKENNMGYYIDYLRSKSDLYQPKREEEDNISLIESKKEEEENKVKEIVNIEDFNNFDYIPGDEAYIAKEEEEKKEKEKIISELLEPPKDINEILPKESNINLSYDEEDIGKMLSERLRKRKKENCTFVRKCI